MKPQDANAVFMYIAKVKQENMQNSISREDIEKATGFDTLYVWEILKHLKEKEVIRFIITGGRTALNLQLTSDGWDYLWEKEDTIKRLLKGTKFEKLLEVYRLAKEKINKD